MGWARVQERGQLSLGVAGSGVGDVGVGPGVTWSCRGVGQVFPSTQLLGWALEDE